jgi:hypothetical protein
MTPVIGDLCRFDEGLCGLLNIFSMRHFFLDGGVDRQGRRSQLSAVFGCLSCSSAAVMAAGDGKVAFSAAGSVS